MCRFEKLHVRGLSYWQDQQPGSGEASSFILYGISHFFTLLITSPSVSGKPHRSQHSTNKSSKQSIMYQILGGKA